MATDKLFTVAGISNLNGRYKVRFANDIMRIKVLAKSGHTDIRLADLQLPMTKITAARCILTMEEFGDAVAQSTIQEYIQENTPVVQNRPATPQVPAIKGMTPLGIPEAVTAPF